MGCSRSGLCLHNMVPHSRYRKTFAGTWHSASLGSGGVTPCFLNIYRDILLRRGLYLSIFQCLNFENTFTKERWSLSLSSHQHTFTSAAGCVEWTKPMKGRKWNSLFTHIWAVHKFTGNPPVLLFTGFAISGEVICMCVRHSSLT